MGPPAGATDRGLGLDSTRLIIQLGEHLVRTVRQGCAVLEIAVSRHVDGGSRCRFVRAVSLIAACLHPD